MRRTLGAASLAGGLALLVALGALLAAGCRGGPEPIRYGEEECAYCRMRIEEPRHGAQAASARGLAYKFDSVECLAAWVRSNTLPENEIGSLWVTDFEEPDRWLSASEAVYLWSERIQSPMGIGLAAHGSPEAAEEHRAHVGGEILTWEEVLDLVTSEWGHDHGIGRTDSPGGPDSGDYDLVVEPGGEVSTLAEALERARDGDRILVRPGAYREHGLTVNRPVTLVGEGWPLVDGGGLGTLLRVRADEVEIRGFRLTGTGISHLEERAAVEVEDARDCTVRDNRLEGTFFGIVLARTRDCAVIGNRLEGIGGREAVSGNGIHLWYSSGTRIEDNRIRTHRDGIYLEFAEDTRVSGNRSHDNHRYGLHFMFSDGSEVGGNAFRSNGAGVAVMYTKRVRFHDNAFRDNWGSAAYGLLLKEITDGEIEGNLLRRNTVALYSEGSDRVTVRGNRFERNGWAAKVMANSQENLFVDNDFVANAFDVATNSRRNPNTFRENFWSGYDGYDLSGDGFGDVPHRPVRLFALLVERTPQALILLRSPFVDLLDVAERVLPVLTPETLVDPRPRMREVAR